MALSQWLTFALTLFYVLWLIAVLALLWFIWRSGERRTDKMQKALLDSVFTSTTAAQKTAEAACAIAIHLNSNDADMEHESPT